MNGPKTMTVNTKRPAISSHSIRPPFSPLTNSNQSISTTSQSRPFSAQSYDISTIRHFDNIYIDSSPTDPGAEPELEVEQRQDLRIHVDCNLKDEFDFLSLNHVRRNLNDEFDELAVENINRGLNDDFDLLGSTVNQNSTEEKFGSRSLQINTKFAEFRATWGYDPVLDHPVRGSEWEWTHNNNMS